MCVCVCVCVCVFVCVCVLDRPSILTKQNIALFSTKSLARHGVAFRVSTPVKTESNFRCVPDNPEWVKLIFMSPFNN